MSTLIALHQGEHVLCHAHLLNKVSLFTAYYTNAFCLKGFVQWNAESSASVMHCICVATITQQGAMCASCWPSTDLCFAHKVCFKVWQSCPQWPCDWSWSRGFAFDNATQIATFKRTNGGSTIDIPGNDEVWNLPTGVEWVRNSGKGRYCYSPAIITLACRRRCPSAHSALAYLMRLKTIHEVCASCRLAYMRLILPMQRWADIFVAKSGITSTLYAHRHTSVVCLLTHSLLERLNPWLSLSPTRHAELLNTPAASPELATHTTGTHHLLTNNVLLCSLTRLCASARGCRS